MITRQEIERLRALSILMVATMLGIKVRRRKALCPYHSDKRPSLALDARKNRFRCFACGASGDVIDLVMKVRNVGFAEACRWLGGDSTERHTEVWMRNPPMPKEAPKPDVEYLSRLMCQPVLNDEARRFLFHERKIAPEVVSQLGLSSISYPCPMSGAPRPAYFDGPALLIPYRDLDGSLMSVQSRYLGQEKGKPRFRFPLGSNCRVFNLPVLKKLLPGEPLFIAEGVSDALALMSAGCQSIAIPSATLLKDEDTALLEGLNLHMYPDADDAGERLYLQLKERCPQLVRHSLPAGVKDVGEHWKNIRSIQK